MASNQGGEKLVFLIRKDNTMDDYLKDFASNEEFIDDIFIKLLFDVSDKELSLFEPFSFYYLTFSNHIDYQIKSKIRKLNSITFSVPKFAKNYAFIITCYIYHSSPEDEDLSKLRFNEFYELILIKFLNIKSKSISDYRFILKHLGIELIDNNIKEPN